MIHFQTNRLRKWKTVSDLEVTLEVLHILLLTEVAPQKTAADSNNDLFFTVFCWWEWDLDPGPSESLKKIKLVMELVAPL